MEETAEDDRKEVTAQSHSNTDTLDDIPDHLPQGELLGSAAGKGKAAVMRRNTTGRRKPTREGLRNSLLKSTEEADLFHAMYSKEGDKSPTSPSDDVPPPRPPHYEPAVTKTPRDQRLTDLNADLSSALRNRHSPHSNRPAMLKPVDETDEPSIRKPVKPLPAVRKPGNYHSKDKDLENQKPEVAPKRPAKLNRPNILIPDVVPHSRLPDIAPGVGRSVKREPVGMEMSPEQKPTSPDISAFVQLRRTSPTTRGATSTTPNSEDSGASPWANRLRPSSTRSDSTSSPGVSAISTTSSRTSDVESEDNIPNPWSRKLNKTPHTRQSRSDKGDESPTAPWTPKLRKVEPASARSTSSSDRTIDTPLKPKLTPTNRSSELLQKAERQVPAMSVSLSSLPVKTITASPGRPSKPAHLQPLTNPSRTEPVKEDSEKRFSANLRNVSEDPKLRKPTNNSAGSSTPDWIKQAAEKRKRASQLIEQTGTLKGVSLSDLASESSPSAEKESPFVQLRSKNRERAGSKGDTSSDNVQSEASSVPEWKRELNRRNSQRNADGRNKAKSPIEFGAPLRNADKENSGRNSVSPWKAGLKDRGSMVDIKENPSESEPKPEAELEFMKMFKRRQERLKKSDSQVSEC